MGVHGLTGYIDENHQFFNKVKLQNTKIIIDGNNLFHRLYFDSALDFKYGGDYDLFTNAIHTFFEALSQCHICPYVVLDGGRDSTDKKIETIKERAKNKIRIAHALSRGDGGTLLPILAGQLFKQVLFQMQVPFVQCHSEADREIATLANQWACPVLSQDSDFCIFNLKAGYYPLKNFKWKNTSVSKDSSGLYIPALCFSIEKFCTYFSNMNRDLLPLIGVLIGNDYVNLALDTFFSKECFPIGRSASSGRKHIRIHGLLKWLSGFAEPKAVIEIILKYFNEKDQEELRKCLPVLMEDYTESEVDLAVFFQSGKMGFSHVPAALASKVPEWLIVTLMNGNMAPFISDCLVMRGVFLPSQVENTRRPSSHNCSLHIRNVMYGLLLNSNEISPDSTFNFSSAESGKTNSVAEKQCKMFYVEEFDRHEQSLKKNTIQAKPGRYSLNQLPEISASVKASYLLEALEVKPDVLPLPAHLQLPVIITCYWMTHAEPRVTLFHLQALLLCFMTGELHKMICEADSSGTLECGVQMVYDRLSHLKPRTRNLDVDVAHIFCQWQSCLLMGIYLNQLLGCPFPEPDLTRLYSGTRVHFTYYELKLVSADHLLKESPTAHQIYHSLLCTVTATVPGGFFQKKRKSKKSKGKQATALAVSLLGKNSVEDSDWHDANNRFAALNTEDLN
ncbi:protein asteroid homolog 1 [Callorhinchus milii]|uniref:protein asteroid homolog 1 n=1 Tax=Callorhinchus milii TaxID=7868 RepID=UPI001C3F70A3|nr:protein asteroid homolog 1 [Callorhinchus milii]XP_042188069.1 protein asteroid homolog 1 [Callorhinchus milii]XP_042188070.1 protein asteroid homolog 1 [Callorhinchus milii]XP_042188071.1 protein asteroid homolog 1 [Callorhinchus milii]